MVAKTEAVALAGRCAAWYARRGWNPLPSRSDKKAPAMRSFTRERDEGLPASVLEHWYAANIQIPTGCRWGIVAVDLDGPEAVGVWRTWASTLGCPPTWEVISRNEDGSVRGVHLWFTLPAGTDRVPTRVLWGVWDASKPGWERGRKVELIGDRGLIIAPPSVHVKTGMPYEFRRGPRDQPAPAELPAWVLGMVKPVPVFEPPLPPLVPMRQLAPTAYRWRDVLAAIPSKGDLVREWAPWMVVSERPNDAGWLKCRHDPGDRNPSASLHDGGGVFKSWCPEEVVSFFDLAVRLGAYPGFAEAVDGLGRRFGVAPRAEGRP